MYYEESVNDPNFYKAIYKFWPAVLVGCATGDQSNQYASAPFDEFAKEKFSIHKKGNAIVWDGGHVDEAAQADFPAFVARDAVIEGSIAGITQAYAGTHVEKGGSVSHSQLANTIVRGTVQEACYLIPYDPGMFIAALRDLRNVIPEGVKISKYHWTGQGFCFKGKDFHFKRMLPNGQEIDHLPMTDHDWNHPKNSRFVQHELNQALYFELIDKTQHTARSRVLVQKARALLRIPVLLKKLSGQLGMELLDPFLSEQATEPDLDKLKITLEKLDTVTKAVDALQSEHQEISQSVVDAMKEHLEGWENFQTIDKTNETLLKMDVLLEAEKQIHLEQEIPSKITACETLNKLIKRTEKEPFRRKELGALFSNFLTDPETPRGEQFGKQLHLALSKVDEILDVIRGMKAIDSEGELPSVIELGQRAVEEYFLGQEKLLDIDGTNQALAKINIILRFEKFKFEFKAASGRDCPINLDELIHKLLSDPQKMPHQRQIKLMASRMSELLGDIKCVHKSKIKELFPEDFKGEIPDALGLGMKNIEEYFGGRKELSTLDDLNMALRRMSIFFQVEKKRVKLKDSFIGPLTSAQMLQRLLNYKKQPDTPLTIDELSDVSFYVEKLKRLMSLEREDLEKALSGLKLKIVGQLETPEAARDELQESKIQHRTIAARMALRDRADYVLDLLRDLGAIFKQIVGDSLNVEDIEIIKQLRKKGKKKSQKHLNIGENLVEFVQQFWSKCDEIGISDVKPPYPKEGDERFKPEYYSNREKLSENVAEFLKPRRLKSDGDIKPTEAFEQFLGIMGDFFGQYRALGVSDDFTFRVFREGLILLKDDQKMVRENLEDLRIFSRSTMLYLQNGIHQDEVMELFGAGENFLKCRRKSDQKDNSFDDLNEILNDFICSYQKMGFNRDFAIDIFRRGLVLFQELQRPVEEKLAALKDFKRNTLTFLNYCTRVEVDPQLASYFLYDSLEQLEKKRDTEFMTYYFSAKNSEKFKQDMREGFKRIFREPFRRERALKIRSFLGYGAYFVDAGSVREESKPLSQKELLFLMAKRNARQAGQDKGDRD